MTTKNYNFYRHEYPVKMYEVLLPLEEYNRVTAELIPHFIHSNYVFSDYHGVPSFAILSNKDCATGEDMLLMTIEVSGDGKTGVLRFFQSNRAMQRAMDFLKKVVQRVDMFRSFEINPLRQLFDTNKLSIQDISLLSAKLRGMFSMSSNDVNAFTLEHYTMFVELYQQSLAFAMDMDPGDMARAKFVSDEANFRFLGSKLIESQLEPFRNDKVFVFPYSKFFLVRDLMDAYHCGYTHGLNKVWCFEPKDPTQLQDFKDMADLLDMKMETTYIDFSPLRGMR